MGGSGNTALPEAITPSVLTAKLIFKPYDPRRIKCTQVNATC